MNEEGRYVDLIFFILSYCFYHKANLMHEQSSWNNLDCVDRKAGSAYYQSDKFWGFSLKNISFIIKQKSYDFHNRNQNV